MFYIIASQYDFWSNALEKGGLPAFVVAIFGTIFLIWLRSIQKQNVARDEARQKELVVLQKEREKSRERDAKQYAELMHAYEEIVGLLLSLSQESTAAITRLSERVGQCPLREVQPRSIGGEE